MSPKLAGVSPHSPDDDELANELAWAAADHGLPGDSRRRAAIPETLAAHRSRWNWILLQPIRAADSDAEANAPFFECLKLILDQQVDPDVPSLGRTTLHYCGSAHGSASSAARARFAAILLDHGANLTLRDDLLKSTPLGWACRWGHNELVALLLDRGAPAHEPDAEPFAQPLAWAHKMNHPEIVALLEARTRR